MAAAREVKEAKPEKSGEVVLVPMAYAAALTGEVVQLHKGAPVSADRYVEGSESVANSLAHLRSIGFIGSQD